MSLEWPNIAAMIVVLSAVGGLGFIVLRARLSRDFVPWAEYNDVKKRIETLEAALQQIPRHADLMALERKLADVSVAVASTNAFVQSLKDDTGAIRHQLNMFIEAKLAEEKS